MQTHTLGYRKNQPTDRAWINRLTRLIAIRLRGHKPVADGTTRAGHLSPALLATADIIAAAKGVPSGGELAAARVLLAAHARELSTLIYSDVQADRKRNPGSGGNGRNHMHRGGMMTAQQTIDRYADDLDAQTAGGEA